MELKLILEAILFSAQKPLSLKEIRDVFAVAPDHAEGDEVVRGLKKVKEEELTAALEQLAQDHQAAQRSYRLVCVAGSWQFVTEPAYAPWLKALVGHRARPPRLSAPGLETLAIIAYRQPITRAEIEQVRGVAVDGVMQTLLERGLVAQAGRAEVIGRPMTYATTPLFLEYFGLRGLEDLPAADELRRIVVEKPEALATVDPGLATAPEQAAAQGEATVESLTTEGGEQAQPSQVESPKSEVQAPEAAVESPKTEEPAAEPAAEAPQAEAPAPKKPRRSRSKQPAATQGEATVESRTTEGGEQAQPSPAESPKSEGQTSELAAEEARAESPTPEATAESPKTEESAVEPAAEASAPKKSRRSRKAKAQEPEASSPASEAPTAPAAAAPADPASEVKESDETSGTPQGD